MTLRADFAVKPCAFCPAPPPPPPVERPCVLCLKERRARVESPIGSLVNGEPACAAHVTQVRALRSRMYMAEHEPDVWAVVLEKEAAEEAAIVAAYHRRRASYGVMG